MTRARILADYVSGGTTAAEFDYLDGVTSNIQTQFTALDTAKAPLASPAFTGTPTGITAAHLEAGVLPSDVTGGSGLTALGTVATGNLSNTAIVYPAGQVLNTANAAITDGSSVTHTAVWTDVGLSATLSGGLRQANAKVLMQYSVQFDCYYEESGAKCQCEDSIEGATYAEVRDTQSYFHLGGTASGVWGSGRWWHGQVVCTGFLKTLSNSVGDTYTVKVRAYRTDGTDVYTHYASVGETTRRSNLTIQEIAL